MSWSSPSESARRGTLGVVGVSPLGVTGLVSFPNTAAFQGTLGQIESARPGGYLAGHTACHAFMNGFTLVRFFGVENLDEAEKLGEAVRELLWSGVDVLVVPGLVGEIVETVVATAVEVVDKGELDGHRPTVWLDAPRGATTAQVVAHQERYRAGSLVRVATPWVDTITPGRRSHELLPPTCLVAPLFMGTVGTLKGIHDISSPPILTEQRLLEEAGCGLLVPDGWQHKVRLAFPTTDAAIEPRARVESLQARIERELDHACQLAIESWSPGPRLWGAVEREAFTVMRSFQERGEIVVFQVRCDEETNEVATDGIGLQVWYQPPKRVREFVLNVTLTEKR